ncbi:MAG: HepT-like ribonuclease domain-containing protein [Candidatus Flexifilum sp.]
MNDRRETDILLLQDMLRFARRAQRRVSGIARSDLEANDELIGAALIYDIFVIGEAANHVSADLQTAYPSVPWRQIIGLRNVLGHQYSDVNYDILWIIATDNVPGLIAQLELILTELTGSSR